MQYIELIRNSSIPNFKSELLGQGTAAENKAAFEGSLAMYGTYTVDKDGKFLGNRVDGATFPNWIDDVRTRKDLTLEVNGDGMVENFKQPDGTNIRILWERVR